MQVNCRIMCVCNHNDNATTTTGQQQRRHDDNNNDTTTTTQELLEHLEHLVRPRSPELNQKVLRYVLHLRRHHRHVRMLLWLLLEQQPTVHAHLLGVNVAK